MIISGWKRWYKDKHDSLCVTLSGQAFEDYVVKLLKQIHPDFIEVDAMGSQGDGGCDGLAEHGTILYACYGQRATEDTDGKTARKLNADLRRAVDQWSGFTTWRFVTNGHFGKKPANALLVLQEEFGSDATRPLILEVWRPDDLWWKAGDLLTWQQFDRIIPGVPGAANVELEDMLPLIAALEAPVTSSANGLGQIRPVLPTKMDFNKLPDLAKEEFNEGRILAPRIDRWFAEQAEPGLRDATARTFRSLYEQARAVTADPREILGRLYRDLGGSDFDLSTKRANAVYAVTAYFFDSCDIFEEPPADQDQGGGDDVAAD